MTGIIQIYNSPQLHVQHRGKKFHPYRLKRPWSYGRGYVVIAGIVLVVLVSLAGLMLSSTRPR